MPSCTYKVTQGNRDYSAPAAGGGSDTATFQHAKGWNGGDVRDIWARLDLTTGTAPSPGATINTATMGVCATSTTQNDLALDLHWFPNPPLSFTTAWSRSSTTVSSFSSLVSSTDVPDAAYATVDVASWLQQVVNDAGYVQGGPLGVALLGSDARSEQINIRTYDSDPNLALYVTVDWSEPSSVEVDTSGVPTLVKVAAALVDLGKVWRVNIDGAGPGPLIPVLTVHPLDVTVAAGNPAVLSATASTWVSAQWQYRDDLGEWKIAEGTVTNDGEETTYQTNPTNTWHNGRQYRAVFTSSTGAQVTSNPAEVTVTGLDPDPDPGPTPGGFSDSVVWRPTSVAGWSRHTQSGHESTDLLVTSDVNGGPPFPDLNTLLIHHPGDRFPTNGGYRTEWRPMSPTVDQKEGEEYWIGWFFYLPVGYPNPESSSWGRIMGQMHGGSGSPNWAVRHDPDGSLRLDIRGGAVNANLRQPTLLSSIPRGRAVRYKMFVRAASNNSGLIRVWIDGVRRGGDFTGPNKYTGSGGYIKFGMYGSNSPSPNTRMWMGGWIKSRVEADIDYQHSRYTG